MNEKVVEMAKKIMEYKQFICAFIIASAILISGIMVSQAILEAASIINISLFNNLH